MHMKPFRVLFFLLIAQAASAQVTVQTIRGTVVDKETQIPIPGVRVELATISPVGLAVSDMDGKFRLDSIPVGRHNLLFTSMGYQPVVINNAELKPAKELILNIQMEESVLTAKEVEVKAEKEKGQVNNDMATVSSRTF